MHCRRVERHLPALQVIPGRLRLGGLQELAGEPVVRGGHGAEERFQRVRPASARLLRDDDAGAACHLADGGGIVQPGSLHQPGKDIAGLVADEAVVSALLGDDREIAVGAAVEGARPPVVGAGALEVHRLADEADQIRAVADLLDDVVGDEAHAENSTIVTPVPP
jgi:hypothetical protein